MIINGTGGAKELALKIVGGTVQPAGVAGRLWVETGAAIAAWTMDSLAPAAPANGDVWVELSDRIAATINVLRHNAIMARVKRVWQYSGAEWVRKNAYYHNGSAWAQVAKFNTVYGVRWTYSASSPLLTRLEDAAGLTATGSVGTTAGASDFDDLPIYGDIRLCNLADNGTVNAYYGDPTFTRDGSNGQVMVEIPAFWVKVVDDTANSQWSVYITDGPMDGYALHPMFQHNGATQTRIYIAAYNSVAGYLSKTGGSPLVNQTRATTRSGITAAHGANWSNISFAARTGVTLLFVIEFASMDAQTAIGEGVTNATAVHVTGETDNIPNGTGRVAGTSNLCAVVWRWIENWWGNVNEWVDGLNMNAGVLYSCLYQALFADDTATNYDNTGVTLSTSLTWNYATRLSASVTPLPIAFSGGSSTTYLCDGTQTLTGWRTARTGGAYSTGAISGLWNWAMDIASGSVSSTTGTRLMYVPEAA